MCLSTPQVTRSLGDSPFHKGDAVSAVPDTAHLPLRGVSAARSHLAHISPTSRPHLAHTSRSHLAHTSLTPRSHLAHISLTSRSHLAHIANRHICQTDVTWPSTTSCKEGFRAVPTVWPVLHLEQCLGDVRMKGGRPCTCSIQRDAMQCLAQHVHRDIACASHVHRMCISRTSHVST